MTMLAFMLRDLKLYAQNPTFRRIQFVITGLFAFALFIVAYLQFLLSERHPQSHIGESIYALLTPAYFLMSVALFVPLQVVESIQMDRQPSNWAMLCLAPIGRTRILLGKLFAFLIATLWQALWVTPLFCFSAYTGGLPLRKLLLCLLVFLVASAFFALIGMAITLVSPAGRAVSRSYAVVLVVLFVPLIAPTWSAWVRLPAAVLDLMRIFSPFCVLIAVVTGKTQVALGFVPIWVWMCVFYAIFSTLLFWVCCADRSPLARASID